MTGSGGNLKKKLRRASVLAKLDSIINALLSTTVVVRDEVLTMAEQMIEPAIQIVEFASTDDVAATSFNILCNATRNTKFQRLRDWKRALKAVQLVKSDKADGNDVDIAVDFFKIVRNWLLDLPDANVDVHNNQTIARHLMVCSRRYGWRTEPPTETDIVTFGARWWFRGKAITNLCSDGIKVGDSIEKALYTIYFKGGDFSLKQGTNFFCMSSNVEGEYAPLVGPDTIEAIFGTLLQDT